MWLLALSDDDIFSPVNFCYDDTFEYTRLAFAGLQEIPSNMQCSLCGPYPKIVIADGISVSFPSDQRTDTLRSATTCDKNQTIGWSGVWRTI